ncbi:Ger(x)C family spore germination protein [Sporosarcina soli]|uniref:Ger(X)C family spore germination protein n=1 Tax=Sporosarcina soli TaxID=334736 RepID=A0ABW0TQJ5_9BACL
MSKVIYRTKHTLLKKMLLFSTLVVPVFFVGGCGDRTEINDLAIVVAATIDKSDKGQVELAIEIVVPKSMGSNQGEGGGGGGQATLVRSQKGDNLPDALSMLQADLSRKVFWGSCKVFIFGEGIAKDGIQDSLDFLVRDPLPRERAFVFVSEGEAKPFIGHKVPLERNPAEMIREMTARGSVNGVTLLELDEMMLNEDHSASLPYLTIKEEETSDGTLSELPKINGTAMFRKDKMVGVLTESTTRGLLWLKDRIKEASINMTPENVEGDLSMTQIKSKVNLTPKISGGEWTMIIKVKTEGVVVQNSTVLNLDDPKQVKKIEKAFGKQIEDRMRKAIEESQDMRVDAAHFGKEFHRKYPKQWKTVKGRWEEVFPEVKIEFVIDAHIRSRGFVDESIKERGSGN